MVDHDEYRPYTYDIKENPLLQLVLVAAFPTSLILIFSLYVSFRLRRLAWNSTSKRFNRLLEICFVSLYSLSFTFWTCCSAVGMGLVLIIVLVLSTNFCMTVSATALLLQTISPWLSDREQQRCRSPAAKRCKSILEVLALVVILVYNVTWVLLSYSFASTSISTDYLFIPISLYYIWSLLILIICFILQVFNVICLLLFVYLAIQKKRQIFRLKLFTFVTIIVIDSLLSITLFCVLLSACFYYNVGFFPVLVANILSVFVFVTSVSAMTYSTDAWHCCSHSQGRSGAPNSRTPLLYSQRQGEDRRHTSSLTTSFNPLEMSDCKSSSDS